jgi:hypothetical protein
VSPLDRIGLHPHTLVAEHPRLAADLYEWIDTALSPVATRKEGQKQAKAKASPKEKEKFEKEDDTFNVDRRLIHNRSKRGNLEVAHRGNAPPLVPIEVILIGYIILAARANLPLSVHECIMLMTSLMSGTIWETHYIEWKKKMGIYAEDQPLVGTGWWNHFSERNKELIEGKYGIKKMKQRSLH